MDEASRSVGWNTPGNAERYAAYVARHPLYDLTSRALVDDLALTAGEVVVDLCCGTGATTRAVLARAPDVRIVAIDLSSTQLEIARRDIADDRVTFVHAPAERADEAVPGGCDAVICNAAVWQLAPPAVRAVSALLRRPGRFAFNLPAPFAPSSVAELCQEDPGVLRFARQKVDTLERAMLEEARALVPAPASAPSGPAPASTPTGRVGFIERRYLDALAAEGFRIARRTALAVPISPEAAFDWYMIPVFRSNVLRGIPDDTGEQVLRTAYARWRPVAPETFALWVNFVVAR